jgi:type IV pilus biogenesis protein CpaD/CtpE
MTFDCRPFILRPRIAAALAGIALLAGCNYQPIGTFDRPDYRVQAASQGLVGLRFLPGRDAFAAGEEQRLATFLASMASLELDDVLLTAALSGSPELDRARLRAASRIVEAAGLPVTLLAVDDRTPGQPLPPEDVVLVEALRTGQLLVACPSAYLDRSEDLYAARLPQMNCANAANLAHMASQRRDLIEPRRLGRMPADLDARAVDRLRAGQVTPPPPLATGR